MCLRLDARQSIKINMVNAEFQKRKVVLAQVDISSLLHAMTCYEGPRLTLGPRCLILFPYGLG